MPELHTIHPTHAPATPPSPRPAPSTYPAAASAHHPAKIHTR
jgi:hypothetical protein